MDLREKAQGAPYHLATSLEECPLGRFWVVQLDCGLEVYQSEERSDCDEPSPWLRLKRFCKDNNARPVNMARAGKDLNPSTQVNLDPTADAYFYARRARKMMCAHPAYSGYEDSAQGIGQLRGETLEIFWEYDDGRGTEVETRPLKAHPKSDPELSLIRK